MLKKSCTKQGMVVPAAIPALWCVMQEEVKFEVCLGYTVTCCLNKHTSKQTNHVLSYTLCIFCFLTVSA